MKMLGASIFIYLCCGAASFAHNYFKARTIVDEERLRATLRPLALFCAIVFWLPYMIAMQFSNPLRDFAMKQAQEMLRGPSIEPMMPAMKLPEACGHLSCKSFDGIEFPYTETEKWRVLWCESCGALCIKGDWVKPNDSLYLPMPPWRQL